MKILKIFLLLIVFVLNKDLISAEISEETLNGLMKKFNITDKKIAEEIANYAVKTYGIKNFTQERIIDGIVRKYNMTIDDLKKMEPLKIKIGTLAPPNTPWIENAMKTIVPFMVWNSRGMITTSIYAGGVMGEDTDIIRKMALGQLQGCGCTALGVFSAVPEMTVFNLPFLFNNYDEVDFILKKFRKDIDLAFDRKGYVLVSLIDTGFFYLYTKDKVTNLSELAKLKPVTWFGEVERAFYNKLGMNFIPVSVPEIVMSLQTGIINASISPPLWWMGTQAFQYSKYFIKEPFFYSPAAIFLSKKELEKTYKKYPEGMGEEVTSITTYIMKAYEKEWDRAIREFETKCKDAFQRAGIEGIEFEEKDMDRLKSLSREIWYSLAGKLYTKEFLDKIINELEEYRKHKK